MRSADVFLERFRGPLSRSAEAEGRDAGAPQVVGPGARPVVVEGYTVEGLIAFGGQGAVYKARQQSTGRLVAIKVPLADTQRRPSTRYRFEREVELAARLDHPGVVRIIEACRLDDGRLGYVMEFVEGESFDRWAASIRPDGQSGLRRIVSALADVADSIAYAHLRAVLHRDIKPSNVVVTKEGRARILDFGLAKAIDGSGSSFTTVTGAFMGTLAYAAPEQINSGADAADLRTDVYALGLLLFQAITGELPYSTDAPTADMLRQIREVEPPRPSSLAPGISNDLDAIVLKALAKEKDRRYSTAGDLRDDLRAWLEGSAVQARFDSRWYVIRKTIRRHRWGVSAAAATLAVMLVVGGLALAFRDQAIRTRLADAVRDVQIIESHHVRMADARTAASDNFQFGETAAWDALLEPAPALVARGIEGADASGLPDASPAYWALWEIYHRTPVVATIPDLRVTSGAFAESPGRLITTDADGLTWWDWRRGKRLQRVALSPGPIALLTGWGRILMLTQNSGVMISDASGTDWERLPLDATKVMRLGNGRVVTLSSDRSSWTLWDTTRHPIRTLSTHHLSNAMSHNAWFDGVGRYFGAVDLAGAITIVDSRTGQVVYTRPSGTAPTMATISSRGKEGEFVAWGLGGAMLIAIGKQGEPPVTRIVPQESVHELVPHSAEYFVSRPGVDRYLYRTAYGTIGMLTPESVPSDREQLHNFSGVTADLSHRGDFLLLTLRDIRRVMIFEITAQTVRRLPFRSEPGPRGFATIFDLVFSADGDALYAASIDGSVRRFETRSEGGESDATIIAAGLDGGAIRLLLTPGGILVGSHYHAQQRPRLTLLKPDGASKTLATASQRFTSIVAREDGTVMALADSGELFHIDPRTETILRQVSLEQLTRESVFRSLAIMPEGGPLLVANGFGGVLLLDAQTLEGGRIITPRVSIRRILALRNDPGSFVTAGDDGLIRVWRLGSRDEPATLVREFGSHAGPIFCMALHPNGRLLATGGGAPETRDVRIWDIDAGRELASLDLFAKGVFDIEFSPDGRWLAAGGEVNLERIAEGGQLFLIDLHGPDRSIAGNLEYHIARFTQDRGRPPSQSDALRRLFPREPASAPERK